MSLQITIEFFQICRYQQLYEIYRHLNPMKRIFTLVPVLFYSALLIAQTEEAIVSSDSIFTSEKTDSIEKIKIGLVLSGGAAKGLAHIGILKVFEQLGITPDYITGTSIGAVVGSMYAIGYTADEISEFNQNADWNVLLSDRIPLNKIVYEEKYEYKRFIFGIPIRNYKFKLPSGAIAGHQLEKFFADVMWPLTDNENFDSLPIPFHCMSVDLISGKTIEIGSGNLAESVRASMSIPSIFIPENIDTMLLVDGGVIRNFPVEEVIKMGADLVIAVYVGFEEEVTKEDMFSFSDVLARSAAIYSIYDSKAQEKYADILIEPLLPGISASDFTKAKRIENLGELAAFKIIGTLNHLVDSLDLEYTPVRKIYRPEKILIEEIAVENDRTFVSDKFIIGRSGIKKGNYVSKEDLSKAVDEIFGTQYFRKVTYAIEAMNENSYRLIFKVIEKTRAFLNFAARYDNQYGTGIITNLTLRNYLAPASRALVTFNIAENPGVRVDINKYFGKNQRIINNYFVNWYRNENKLYQNSIDIGSYRLNYMNAGLGGKYSITVNHQFGVLGFYEMSKMMPNENLKQYFQTESFDSYSYKGFAYKLFYAINSTDDNFFPHRGVKLDVHYKHNFKPTINSTVAPEDSAMLGDFINLKTNSEAFYSGYFNLDYYFSFFDKLIFNVGTSFGISSDESISISNYNIGGDHWDSRTNHIPFVGMDFAEAMVPNFSILKTGIDFEIFPKIYLSAKANIGNYGNSIDEFFNSIKTSSLKFYRKGYSFGIRANTIIGPISVMCGDNNYDNYVRWYISIGYPF